MATADYLVHIRSESCFAALCDEGSPANKPGCMKQAEEAGRRAAPRPEEQESYALGYRHRQMLQSVKQRDLIVWTLALEGTYRAVAEIVAPEVALELRPAEDPVGAALGADLVCPTGRLVVTCLSRLGEPQRPLIVLDPGIYRIVLDRDLDQEAQGGMAEITGRHPKGGRPDWRLRFQRLGPCVEGG